MKGDILSGVIVVAIVISSTILVINTINPFIQESKNFQSFNEAKATLEKVNTAINDVFLEAPGSRRTLDLNIREGDIIVSGEEDKIKIILPGNLFEPGISTQQGNVFVTSGGTTMKAYESDINSDGATDLVLENDAVIFAVKKIGNASSFVSINTTNIIPLIRNKRSNVNITPISGIFIGDALNTSYGNGFTELTRSGSTLQSSSIRVTVNSTSGTMYEALFTLRSAQDFVELEIKNIQNA